MKVFTISNFWQLVLEIQLFLLATAFLFYSERKSRFWLRLGICFVVSVSLAYFYPETIFNISFL